MMHRSAAVLALQATRRVITPLTLASIAIPHAIHDRAAHSAGSESQGWTCTRAHIFPVIISRSDRTNDRRACAGAMCTRMCVYVEEGGGNKNDDFFKSLDISAFDFQRDAAPLATK